MCTSSMYGMVEAKGIARYGKPDDTLGPFSIQVAEAPQGAPQLRSYLPDLYFSQLTLP